MSRTALHDHLFYSEPSKTDQRRMKILEVAIKVLAEEGLDKLTFERLGAPLKMTRAHVNYYFKNQWQLHEHIAKLITFRLQQFTIERITHAKDWRAQVEGVIDGAIDWGVAHPHDLKATIWFYFLSTYREYFRKLNSSARETGARRLMAILVPEFERKNIKEKNRYEIVKTIQAIIVGLMLDEISTKKKIDFELLRSKISKSVWQYIGSL